MTQINNFHFHTPHHVVARHTNTTRSQCLDENVCAFALCISTSFAETKRKMVNTVLCSRANEKRKLLRFDVHSRNNTPLSDTYAGLITSECAVQFQWGLTETHCISGMDQRREEGGSGRGEAWIIEVEAHFTTTTDLLNRILLFYFIICTSDGVRFYRSYTFHSTVAFNKENNSI